MNAQCWCWGPVPSVTAFDCSRAHHQSTVAGTKPKRLRVQRWLWNQQQWEGNRFSAQQRPCHFGYGFRCPRHYCCRRLVLNRTSKQGRGSLNWPMPLTTLLILPLFLPAMQDFRFGFPLIFKWKGKYLQFNCSGVTTNSFRKPGRCKARTPREVRGRPSLMYLPRVSCIHARSRAPEY